MLVARLAKLYQGQYGIVVGLAKLDVWIWHPDFTK